MLSTSLLGAPVTILIWSVSLLTTSHQLVTRCHWYYLQCCDQILSPALITADWSRGRVMSTLTPAPATGDTPGHRETRDKSSHSSDKYTLNYVDTVQITLIMLYKAWIKSDATEYFQVYIQLDVCPLTLMFIILTFYHAIIPKEQVAGQGLFAVRIAKVQERNFLFEKFRLLLKWHYCHW